MFVPLCRIFLLLPVLFLASCGQKETKHIPVNDFFKTPEKSFFRISPNGQYISYLKSFNDRQNICIQSLKTGKEQCITSFSDIGVRDYFWSFNNDIVFSKDIQGGDSYNLSTINLKTKKITPVISLDSVRGKLLFRDQNHPDWIVISLNNRNPENFDVYRLNVRTAELNLYITNPGNVTEWYPDWAGKIRLAKESDGVNETLLYRENDNESFKPIIKNNFKNSVTPIVFTDKKSCFYALSNVNRDKAAAVIIDGRTGKEEKYIYGNKYVDVTNATSSRLSRKLIYVGWDDDRPRKHFLLPRVKKVFDEISKSFPDANVRILDRDSAERHFLLSATSDRNPGSYFLYDKISKKITRIADLNPALDSTNLCRMNAVTYKASDGTLLHGYLTLPLNHVAGKKLPLVVLPHSTPWGRNTWGYNDEVQFLANRGYAVFQPNFRGSKGYGKVFHQAGFKQMGGKMQQDIVDGVRWLIAQGVADKNRVGIYGGNFGGFSALYQIEQWPQFYQCAAVSYGLINFFTYLKDVPPYFKPQLSMMYEMVGNPETDAAMFRNISPVFNTAKIKKPLLIFQGAKDPSANLNEINQFVSELRKQKTPVDYILKENERRSFRSEHNKIEQYSRIEAFLETNLKAKR